MAFHGGNQNGAQQGSGQRQAGGQGLQNVQQVLTPQLFNINVNPNQLHTFFSEHNSSQNQLQLNAAAAAAAANAPSILLQSQQQQSFPVNLINGQLGVGVSQLISSASVSQSQMQALPISMSSALNFPQTIQVHAQTAPSQQALQQQSQAQNQQSKQRVFTGTVTKIHDNFGFIDEEVFFQMTVVKGPLLPKEGDRVLVEADFNAQMPFKWNATRVQIVNIGGSLNNMPNMVSNSVVNPPVSQPPLYTAAQHIGFNTSVHSVGIPKQNNAPPPPVLTSQAGNVRPQPVTIVSNPHSVYSGGPGTRGRGTGVGAPGVPQNPMGGPNPMITTQRDSARSMMPEVSVFNSSVTSMMALPSDRDLRIDPEGPRDRSRERARPRSRNSSRDCSRETMRNRSRERAGPPRGRRSIERSLPDRRRSRDRSTERSLPIRRKSRERSNERVLALRRRSRDRSSERPVPVRRRSRSNERSTNVRLRSRSRSRSMEKRSRHKKDRSSESERNVEKEYRKNSISPSSTIKSNTKDDCSTKNKKSNDKGNVSSPFPRLHSTNSEKSKRSRSKESVKTDKGRGTERSRSRSGSPKRKNTPRAAPRYAVEVPKFTLDLKDINVKEMQRRYPNLYIPSDCFLARAVWMDTFPLHSPIELGKPCPTHIMRKGVQKLELQVGENLDASDVLEPPDASFTFKSKVLIPSMSSLETIYRKACLISDSDTDIPDNPHHIDRLINFIVGVKTSKHEVLAMGGPWSPSLDGANPQSDPQTLINTAIRSVRALTGVDLSKCKKWYRFMELYYKRSNCLETVVFYLPDVWLCLPGTKDWNQLKAVYKYALRMEKDPDCDKAEKSTSIDFDGKNSVAPAAVMDSSSVSDLPLAIDPPDVTDQSIKSPTSMEIEDGFNSSGLLVIDEAASPVRDDTVVMTETASSEDTMEPIQPLEDSGAVNETDTGDSVVSSANITPEQSPSKKRLDATHFSLLTPKTMNVAQLRDELGKRGLNSKGLKAQLLTRLVKVLKDEENSESEVKPLQDAQIAIKVQPEEADVSNKLQAGDEETQILQLDVASDVIKLQQSKESTETLASSLPIVKNLEPDAEVDHCIRLVNPSLILESQEDDGELSVEDGELKDDIGTTQDSEFQHIFSKFPPGTFPVIKPDMKEEQIKMWERRYILPKTTRLLIHPSETAKGGNFDCLSMTLGLLRDYRLIDKKEDSFEVSLFSEFFHEMLQRDFAFRIYQEIVTEARENPDKIENKIEKTEKVESVNEPSAKKRKLSNATSNATTDPFLLLSFLFFDVTRCGYITETDLEDLCNSIGLGLTRSQIRKLVQKVVHKGTLYYRKWTDRPKMTKHNKDDIKALAQGNKSFFPVFNFPEERTDFDSMAVTNEETVPVNVNGKCVDVKRLMDQLDKYGKDLSIAESSLNVLKNLLSESKSQVSDLKKSNETLKEELSKIKEALKKSESLEKSAKENVETFRRSTERFLERVKDLVKFPASSSKDKSEISKESLKVKDLKEAKKNQDVKQTVNQEDVELQPIVNEVSSSEETVIKK